jgi:hypothetical protein
MQMDTNQNMGSSNTWLNLRSASTQVLMCFHVVKQLMNLLEYGNESSSGVTKTKK